MNIHANYRGLNRYYDSITHTFKPHLVQSSLTNGAFRPFFIYIKPRGII